MLFPFQPCIMRGNGGSNEKSCLKISPGLDRKFSQIAACFKLLFSIIYKATGPWNCRLDNPETLVEFISYETSLYGNLRMPNERG